MLDSRSGSGRQGGLARGIGARPGRLFITASQLRRSCCREQAYKQRADAVLQTVSMICIFGILWLGLLVKEGVPTGPVDGRLGCRTKRAMQDLEDSRRKAAGQQQ